MNILKFLTPKSMIKILDTSMTIRQVLEVFEHYRYSVLPIINKDGKYYGTISEGDLLYYLKNNLKGDIQKYEDISILEIPIYREYKPIKIDEDIRNLIKILTQQNFVPLVDDQEIFIGIVTRKTLIDYLSNQIKNLKAPD